MAAINFIQARPFQLAEPIGTSDTEVAIKNFFDVYGNPIVMSGDIQYATLEPESTSSQEIISYTGIVQLTTNTAKLTGVTRGLDAQPDPVTGLYGSDPAQASAHSANVKCILSNNPQIYDAFTDRGAPEEVTGDWDFEGDVDFNKSLNATKILKVPTFANAAARDAAITVPSDSMICYINDVEEFMGYKNGAWQLLGSGGGGSAVWYQDSTGDGTITGAINGINTTYTLSHTPGSVDAFVLTYNGQVLERGAGDDYTLVANTITMNFAPVSGKLVAIYPDQGVGTQNATTRSTTGASSLSGELFRKSDDSNSLYYKDNAGDEVKLVDITSNKIPGTSIDYTGGDIAPNVNITSLSLTNAAAGDSLLIHDTSLSANREVLVEGIMQSVHGLAQATPSSNIQFSLDTLRSQGVGSTGYFKLKSIKLKDGIIQGQVRVYFKLIAGSGTAGRGARGQIYINGVPTGTIRYDLSNGVGTTFSEEFNVFGGDEISLYIERENSLYGASCSEFRICYDKVYAAPISPSQTITDVSSS